MAVLTFNCVMFVLVNVTNLMFIAKFYRSREHYLDQESGQLRTPLKEPPDLIDYKLSFDGS